MASPGVARHTGHIHTRSNEREYADYDAGQPKQSDLARFERPGDRNGQQNREHPRSDLHCTEGERCSDNSIAE
jgi:hypothetical protein